MVQLREKDLSQSDLLTLAERVRAITHAFGALMTVNSHLNVARQVGADGVHLPSAWILKGLEAGRGGLLVGCSAHDAEELRKAETARADFVTFSPVFSPTLKNVKGIGLGALKEVTATTRMPVYALGGVTADRVAPCLDAGAYGVAAMSGILAAENVEEAARAYVEALRQWIEGDERRETNDERTKCDRL